MPAGRRCFYRNKIKNLKLKKTELLKCEGFTAFYFATPLMFQYCSESINFSHSLTVALRRKVGRKNHNDRFTSSIETAGADEKLHYFIAVNAAVINS